MKLIAAIAVASSFALSGAVLAQGTEQPPLITNLTPVETGVLVGAALTTVLIATAGDDEASGTTTTTAPSN